MRTLPLLSLLALLSGLPLAAQQMAGTGWRIYANAYTRGGAGAGPGELLQRFDADDVQGYGVEVAFPGVHVVRGIAIQWRDFGSTPNGLCDVTLYGEDPARPNFPDLGNPLGGRQGVATRGQPLAYDFVAFPAPVLVPEGQDLFVGIRVNAASNTFGGVRLNYLPGSQGSLTHDLPGGGLPTSPPEQNSYRLFRDLTTNSLTYLSRGQYIIDLLTLCPGGFATGLTNQSNYVTSTVVPGTTSMMSGLHPDVTDPPTNPGRADDVGFLVLDPRLAPGTPVAFVASFRGFGPNMPLADMVPGSVGAFCLDPAFHRVLALRTLDAQNTAYELTTVPAAARSVVDGLSWVQQAVAFDAATGTLRATQCVRQRF